MREMGGRGGEGADCGIVMQRVLRQKQEKFAKTSIKSSVWHTRFYSTYHIQYSTWSRGIGESFPMTIAPWE
jgi:hypothetical protein